MKSINLKSAFARLARVLAACGVILAFMPLTACYGSKHYHHYITYVVEPTCTERGYTKDVWCCDDNDVRYYDYIDALGHDYAEFVCTRCYEIDPIAPVTVGLEFDEISNGDGTVVGYSATGISGATGALIIVPSEHNGKPVTEIGERAFENCRDVKRIVLPSGLTKIGKRAFENCSKLVKMDMPNGVAKVGDCAFICCVSLKSVTLSGSLLKIPYGMFEYCAALQSIEIPTSVTEICDYAFYNCSDLTTVTLPDTITAIGRYAFLTNSSLWDHKPRYSEYGGALYLGNAENPYLALICVEHTGIRSCIIHPDTKVIAGCAFGGCQYLGSIEIPNGVISVGDEAFINSCVVSISIPPSVEYIGNGAIPNYSGVYVYFDGTIEQWFDVCCNASRLLHTAVVCSDGTVEGELIKPADNLK